MSTWRIIPDSKWLITMVIVFIPFSDRVVGPLPFMAFYGIEMGVILTTYNHWDPILQVRIQERPQQPGVILRTYKKPPLRHVIQVHENPSICSGPIFMILRLEKYTNLLLEDQRNFYAMLFLLKPQMLNVWYIYLHLPPKLPKCR